MSLVSITAYQRVERLQSEDTDAGPNPFIMPTFMAATDTFTQEFRLSGDTDRMRWLLGAFYFNNKVDGHYLLDLTNLGFVPMRTTTRTPSRMQRLGSSSTTCPTSSP